SAHEFSGTIAPCAFAGGNRKARQMAGNVIRELLHGGVAPVRFFAQCLEENVIEIASEISLEKERSCLAHRTDEFRSQFARTVQSCCSFGEHDGRTWALRFFLGNCIRQLCGCARLNAIRGMAGKQLIEDDAERIEITGSGDGIAAKLFGTGIVGSKGTKLRRFDKTRAVENLCDAEVEELGNSFLGHEDVAGFNVAVNDEVLVRVLYGGTNLAEEL